MSGDDTAETDGSTPASASDVHGPPDRPPALSRRALLGGAGAFAVGAGGAALLRGRGAASGTDGAVHGGHGYGHTSAAAAAPPALHQGPAPVGYGHGMMPPRSVTREDALALATPPPPDVGRRTVREYDLSVTEQTLEVADGVIVYAWRYGGRVPGPIIRATEGDRLRIRMDNRTDHAHNVHLHGRHDPAMDGIEPIGPGGSFTYDLVAEPTGLHPYHCHVAPVSEHVGRGLYGTMIVDPPEGRAPAHEFVLVMGGWDLDGDGREEIVTFNGIAGLYERHPITVPVGEPVRLYLVNLVEHEPVVTFHLHAETFDILRSGTSLEPDEHSDVVALTQGERAIVEFTLHERGRYMFHPHQTHLAERGAMGWISAV